MYVSVLPIFSQCVCLVRDEKTTEQSVKVKEMAVLKLGATFAKHKMEEG